jgi:hypothetical protein
MPIPHLGSMQRDMAESHLAHYHHHPVEDIEPVELKDTPSPMKAIDLMLGNILESKNPRLTAECYAMLCGFYEREGISETMIARRYGISKQAVSRHLLRLRGAHKLPPRPFMKSDVARKKYSELNHRNYTLKK